MTLRTGLGLLLLLNSACACGGAGVERGARGSAPPADRHETQGTPAATAPACPADDPAPPEKARPERDRPFVEWIPDEDPVLTRSRSDREARFGNLVCKAKSDVWRDTEGRIRVCTVGKRASVMGIEIAKDAYSHFHEDGRPHQTHLARPQTLLTAAGESVRCAVDLVVISKNGALVHCKLESGMMIGKIACRGGEGVAFHPSGKLAAATIDQPTELVGTTFPAGTNVYFYPTGALSGGHLKEPLRVGGFLVQWRFALHQNGQLRAMELAEPRNIQGNAFPARATVELRKDGTLQRAEHESAFGFMPHGEPWHDTKHLRFDCQGKLLGEYTDHYQAPFPPPRFRGR